MFTASSSAQSEVPWGPVRRVTSPGAGSVEARAAAPMSPHSGPRSGFDCEHAWTSRLTRVCDTGRCPGLCQLLPSMRCSSGTAGSARQALLAKRRQPLRFQSAVVGLGRRRVAAATSAARSALRRCAFAWRKAQLGSIPRRAPMALVPSCRSPSAVLDELRHAIGTHR
jgi:hypothetical protein